MLVLEIVRQIHSVLFEWIWQFYECNEVFLAHIFNLVEKLIFFSSHGLPARNPLAILVERSTPLSV